MPAPCAHDVGFRGLPRATLGGVPDALIRTLSVLCHGDASADTAEDTAHQKDPP